MKDDYLNALKQALIEKNIGKNDIRDIIKDYNQLYDDGIDSGKTPDVIETLLGDPKKVAKEVTYEYTWTNPHKHRAKIIALMPFIALIIFMVLGLVYDLWHPTWLLFLIIPLSAIILETKGLDRIISASPFIAVTAFILLGTYTLYWNPAWLLFLIIPMLAILKKRPLSVLIVYELSFVLAIGFYLLMGYQYGLWSYGALGFILPIVLGIIFQDVIFIFPFNYKDLKKKDLIFIGCILAVILVFLLLGLSMSGWGFAWQVFLLIPMAAIILYDKLRIVSLMPFVSVIIFYSLGYFFDLWTISWLAFLLIPIVSIIFPNE